MIEQIDRLEAEDQRRIPMLLENHSGRQGGFQAVRRAGAHDPAERPQRLALLLLVVREIVQPVLHSGGRAQPGDEPPFRRRQGQARRRDRLSARERASL